MRSFLLAPYRPSHTDQRRAGQVSLDAASRARAALRSNLLHGRLAQTLRRTGSPLPLGSG